MSRIRKSNIKIRIQILVSIFIACSQGIYSAPLLRQNPLDVKDTLSPRVEFNSQLFQKTLAATAVSHTNSPHHRKEIQESASSLAQELGQLRDLIVLAFQDIKARKEVEFTFESFKKLWQRSKEIDRLLDNLSPPLTAAFRDPHFVGNGFLQYLSSLTTFMLGYDESLRGADRWPRFFMLFDLMLHDTQTRLNKIISVLDKLDKIPDSVPLKYKPIVSLQGEVITVVDLPAMFPLDASDMGIDTYQLFEHAEAGNKNPIVLYDEAVARKSKLLTPPFAEGNTISTPAEPISQDAAIKTAASALVRHFIHFYALFEPAKNEHKNRQLIQNYHAIEEAKLMMKLYFADRPQGLPQAFKLPFIFDSSFIGHDVLHTISFIAQHFEEFNYIASDPIYIPTGEREFAARDFIHHVNATHMLKIISVLNSLADQPDSASLLYKNISAPDGKEILVVDLPGMFPLAAQQSGMDVNTLMEKLYFPSQVTGEDPYLLYNQMMAKEQESMKQNLDSPGRSPSISPLPKNTPNPGENLILHAI